MESDVWTSRYLTVAPQKEAMESQIERMLQKPVRHSVANSPATDDIRLPKISIIIPSFNQGHFIEDTILSIISQDYPNFEIIVVDGGSTDNTIDILRYYNKYIFYWCSEKDEGQAHAINKGISKCTGDWVAYQNSDDFFLPGSFKAIQTLFCDSEVDVIYGDMIWVSLDRSIEGFQVNTKAQVWMLKLRMALNNQSLFWRRELTNQIGGFDQSLQFCLDYEFVIRLFLHKCRRRKVDLFIGAQRLHADTKTSRMQSVQHGERMSVASRYFGEVGAFHKFFLFLGERMFKTVWHLARLNIWYIRRHPFKSMLSK